MCPACLTEIFGAVAGPAAGGAGALVLLWRLCKSAKPMAEPPSATFEEWIAAIVAEEEVLASTVRGSKGVSVQTSGGTKTPVPYFGAGWSITDQREPTCPGAFISAHFGFSTSSGAGECRAGRWSNPIARYKGSLPLLVNLSAGRSRTLP